MKRQIFDPEQLPVESIADEAALASERLTPDWLRQRFAMPSDWTFEQIEIDRSLQTDEPIAAAVLIPIIAHGSELTVLLTRRAARLSTHGGQISFPGGHREAGDTSLIDTALRETEEEIGLPRQQVEVLGQLPDCLTGTGYRITPVVALIAPPLRLQLDALEVEQAFEVPLRFLMNGAHHQRRSVRLDASMPARRFYAMPYRDFFIWGATAGMIRNLFHFLRA